MPDPLEANRLILTARIASVSDLRYTPAGVPALDLELQHESQQSEAQVPRTVQLSIKAVVFGELTQRLQALDLTQAVHFKGFLVSPRYGKSVTFHVQDFKTS
jgi:primosomal replication protein N